MKKNKKNLLINGASCTADSPWKTWADLVGKRYQINLTNLGKKGIGNEAIITKILRKAYNTEDPVLIVMLTAVDKWDWYTTSSDMIKKIKKEKHNGYTLDDEDDGIYWSTGSHFPLMKEYYKLHYFSLRQMVLNTLKHISLLVNTCKSKKWPFQVLFDYQVFDYTEHDYLNNTIENINFIENNLIDKITKPFFDDIKEFVELEGLLSTGEKHGLPIIHKKLKAHPGTEVHHVFCKEKIFPFLDQFYPVRNFNLKEIVNAEQKLWDKTNT